MFNKCLLTEWRLDSHPGPKTPSPVLFCPAVSPALLLCSTHEATGLKARRWLPSVPLLHNLSVPRPPALQSCRPAYSQGEPHSDHPGGPPLLAAIAPGSSLVASPPCHGTAPRAPCLKSCIPILAPSSWDCPPCASASSSAEWG